ncbi:MAG: hypothetical protein Q9169_005610, partial [Polycauliona sp. 2 TL-2023]
MLGRVLPAVYTWIRHLRTVTPIYLHQLLTTGAGRTLLGFFLLYLLLIQLCRHAFYRDPASLFFDPSRAYEHVYSAHRQHQADEFLQAANSSVNKPPVSGHPPTMCLGIATVERPGEQYVRSAFGSLMQGLTEDERAQIYTVVLIGHTDPQQHPIYHESWLENTSDQILTYDTSDKTRFDLLVKWENEKDYRRKAIYDYTYLLETCIRSEANWIAMIEDDTLAVKDWYQRTISALNVADSKSTDWLYLRLFFTEKFFGWNSEFWPIYLLSSISIVAAVALLLLALRRFRYHTFISNSAILTACFVYTPACILLYFMAGKLSMQPLSRGVHEMPNYGCCAQGMVFSSRVAGRVVDKLKEKESGFVDMILEEWANEEELTRFAIVPSLLQHIGGHSSKGDDFAPAQPISVAETIFNFGFELYEERGGHVYQRKPN